MVAKKVCLAFLLLLNSWLWGIDSEKRTLDLTGQFVDSTSFAIPHPETIEVLILDSCQLQQLPSGISRFSHLQHLSIQYNPHLDLTQTVSQLAQLKHFRFLNLSHNKLTRLPENFTELSDLTGLRLSYNSLDLPSITPVLAKLPRLRRLWIDNNHLTSFSPVLLTFPQLRFLYAFDNQIQKLVVPKKQSRSLWVLHLGNNHFEELPEGLIQIKNLKMVLLNQNHIHRIPDIFQKSKYSFLALILKDNPLPPTEQEKADQLFGKLMMYQ